MRRGSPSALLAAAGSCCCCMQALQAEVVHAHNRGLTVWPCHCGLSCRAAGRSGCTGTLEHDQQCSPHRLLAWELSRLGCLVAGEGIEAEKLEFETLHSGLLTVNRTKDGLYHLSAPIAEPSDPVPECASAGSPLLMVNDCCMHHAWLCLESLQHAP